MEVLATSADRRVRRGGRSRRCLQR